MPDPVKTATPQAKSNHISTEQLDAAFKAGIEAEKKADSKDHNAIDSDIGLNAVFDYLHKTSSEEIMYHGSSHHNQGPGEKVWRIEDSAIDGAENLEHKGYQDGLTKGDFKWAFETKDNTDKVHPHFSFTFEQLKDKLAGKSQADDKSADTSEKKDSKPTDKKDQKADKKEEKHSAGTKKKGDGVHKKDNAKGTGKAGNPEKSEKITVGILNYKANRWMSAIKDLPKDLPLAPDTSAKMDKAKQELDKARANFQISLIKDENTIKENAAKLKEINGHLYNALKLYRDDVLSEIDGKDSTLFTKTQRDAIATLKDYVRILTELNYALYNEMHALGIQQP